MAKMSSKRKVFLVEDHPITREGFAQLINYQDDLLVCGQAGSVTAAMDGINETKPDLVIVDVTLPDGHGIELVKILRAQLPKLRILVLSMHDESLYAERALQAGARGYVMKQEPTQVVMTAIRQVLQDETYLSAKMQRAVVQRFAGKPATNGISELEHLTDRELQVFELLGRGQSTSQIARRLRISISTVETHRAHLKEKLQTRTGPELVYRAVEWVGRNRI